MIYHPDGYLVVANVVSESPGEVMRGLVFLDLQGRPLLGNSWLEKKNGAFQLQVAAPAQEPVVVDRSSDLLNWVPVTTNKLVYGDDLTIPVQTNASAEFFRVRTL
jgi:hypothetical protein